MITAGDDSIGCFIRVNPWLKVLKFESSCEKFYPSAVMQPQIEFCRRRFLKQSLFGAAALATLPGVGFSREPAEVTFGFSLYGMRKLTVKEALRVCAEIGYDCVELACMADWPSAPETLSAADRQELRSQLNGSGLELGGLMENVAAVADDQTHAANLERLKRACELGHDLAPESTPIVETVLGGQPAAWEQTREKMVERLQDWGQVAAAQKAIIALKPHVGGALHTPDGAVWLMQQLKSDWLRLAYDYSHFELRALPLKASLDAMLPQAKFIHVKDTAGNAGKFQFLLPGDGRTKYSDYFGELKSRGYAGPMVVEVSGQLHTRADYDPVQAAKRSYANLAPLLKEAGIRKPRS